MKRNKKWILALASLCLILALSACDLSGGLVDEMSTDTEGSGTSGPEQPTETVLAEIEIDHPTYEIPAVPEKVAQHSSRAISLYVATEQAANLDCTEVQSVQQAYFAYLNRVNTHLGKQVTRVETGVKNALKDVALALASGSKEQIICILPLAYTAEIYTSGNYHNAYDLPYLNLDQSYWNTDFCAEMQVDGALYSLMGALTPDAAINVGCYVFNQEKTQEMGMDMYGLVRSGDWTFAELNKLACAYEDTNKNGAVDTDDKLGVVYRGNYRPEHLYYGSGLQAFADRGINPELTDEICTQALSNLPDWMLNAYDWMESPTLFTEGKAVAYGTTLGEAAAKQFAAQSGIEIGIVPCPKYAKDAKGYTSPVSMYAATVAVGKSTDAELAGYCLELMAMMADMDLTPLMQDYLYNRLPADENCREMIVLLCENASFDRNNALMYLQDGNPFRQAILNRTSTVTYVKRKGNVEKQMKMIYSGIENAGRD